MHKNKAGPRAFLTLPIDWMAANRKLPKLEIVAHTGKLPMPSARPIDRKGEVCVIACFCLTAL